MKDLVPIAEVARPHGVRGEAKLKLYNPDSPFLTPGAELVLVHEGSAQAVRLEQLRPVSGGAIARLAGVDDRDRVEALRGAQLAVPRGALGPVEDEDEFYIVDLIGCAAVFEQRRLGAVVEVFEYPTCEVLVVELEAEPGARPKRLEVPFLEGYVGEVDVEGRRVEVLSLELLDAV
ncbi:MAG: ribosome maturation factor RimM [Myxococcota bacterium]